MGRFRYWMNVSVDLRVEHATGEDGGGSWMRIDDALHAEFNRRAQQLAMTIEGRRTYEIMESFWPTAQEDESLPDVLREYGRIWLAARKVLVSNTRTEAPHADRIIGGDDALEQIAELRANTDGTIGIGGVTLATQLLRRGLLDELLLFVHPALLGAGRPLFDEVDAPLELELLEHETYASGVAMHRYAIGPTTGAAAG